MNLSRRSFLLKSATGAAALASIDFRERQHRFISGRFDY